MRKNIIKHALLGLVLISVSSMTVAGYSADQIAKGKALYVNKKKGNCIACHMIPDPDAKLPGNQGSTPSGDESTFSRLKVLRLKFGILL